MSFLQIAHQFSRSIQAGTAAAKSTKFVEQKIARRGAVLNGHGCEGACLAVQAQHGQEIDFTQHVDVVE